jgi:predicted kinase
MIIIVFGLPGSGKSFFASRLAKMINADYINSDKLRRKLFSKRSYSTKEKLSVYNAMLAKLNEIITKKKNVVLDATFSKNAIRKRFVEEAGNKSRIAFIEVKAASSLIRERLKRPREDSEADFSVYEKIKQSWEPHTGPHQTLHSTNKNIADMLEKARNYLNIENDEATN